MTGISDLEPDSLGSLHEQGLSHLLDRMPLAISVIGTDGRAEQVTDKARELFDLMDIEPAGRSLGELDWQLLDAGGHQIAADQLPAEITRRTGEEFDNVEIGFPGHGGGTVWIKSSTRRLTDGDPPYVVASALVDATAEREALSEAQLAQQMLERALDYAPNGIALVATDGRWLRVNQALCDLLGYSEEELLRTTFQDLTHPDDLQAALTLVDDVLAGRRTSYQMNKRYIRSDGRQIWAQLSVALVADQDGNPIHFISQVQDVTERHKLEERLRELADRDHLTGLLNRRRFEEELDRQLERCARHEERACLLLLDVDRFKQVNDSGGHAAGDALLQTVADACQRRVRGTDLVARVGGDEFAAILVDSDEQGAVQVAEALLDTIREVAEPAATASIGLTVLRPEDQVDTVMARADRALYTIKESGRDGVRLDDTLKPVA